MRRRIAVLAVAGLLAAGAQAKDLSNKPNDSRVRLSGTVTAKTPTAFTLDHGNGSITVEMDDWDWYAETSALNVGDSVTVNGWIDDDAFEKKKIEAASVYVKDLNTFFYASGADEEDFEYVSFSPMPVASYNLSYTGTVSSVNGREFTLDTGTRKITVDTDEMSYDPMDDLGYQRIKKGDRVTIGGRWDYDIFEKPEVKPDWIVTLRKD